MREVKVKVKAEAEPEGKYHPLFLTLTSTLI
jgi:hypothetical protein